MKLKLSDILIINAGLRGLDGYSKVVKIRDQEQVINEPYVFATGKTIWNIAKNRKITEANEKTFEAARIALVKSISGSDEGIPETDTVKMADFKKKIDEILGEQVVVEGLLKLKLSELLNSNKNPIPPSVLLQLELIIEDDLKE